jgi:hypothetical protein
VVAVGARGRAPGCGAGGEVEAVAVVVACAGKGVVRVGCSGFGCAV